MSVSIVRRALALVNAAIIATFFLRMIKIMLLGLIVQIVLNGLLILKPLTMQPIPVNSCGECDESTAKIVETICIGIVAKNMGYANQTLVCNAGREIFEYISRLPYRQFRAIKRAASCPINSGKPFVINFEPKSE